MESTPPVLIGLIDRPLTPPLNGLAYSGGTLFALSPSIPPSTMFLIHSENVDYIPFSQMLYLLLLDIFAKTHIFRLNHAAYLYYEKL